MLKSTVVGNYPKLPSGKSDVNIRRMLHRLDKREITRAELGQAYDQVTVRVLREQIDAGIDLPTDGQVRWDDIVTPFAAGGEGFQVGGLIRWFDNNVYYRKPQIVSSVKWRQPVAVEGFKLAAHEAGRPIKAVLPSPYSFARLSEDGHYHNDDKLLADLVAFLREETKALIASGATQIQFDEPCLQYQPQHLPSAANALNETVKGLQATFWLCFYFGSVKEIAPHFDKFSVQVVAADCVSHPENFDHLMRFAGDKNPCLGLLDARNIKLEGEESLQEMYKRIAAGFPEAYISPSCGLEFLPHASALDKIKLLGRTVERFNRM